MVPGIHPDNFSQAINVEGVVTLDTAQSVDGGQGVMAKGGLGAGEKELISPWIVQDGSKPKTCPRWEQILNPELAR